MLLIKNGHVIDPKSGRDGIFDLLIQDGKILKIDEEIIEEQAEILDATGLIVGPGLVDVHVHFRDPGFTYKEDIQTGAKASASGGFTSVVMMANTKPAIDNVETLTDVLKRGRETDIHIYSCGNVTVGLKGEELAPMEELKKAGAAGFTDDGIPIMDADLVRKAMEKAVELDMPLSFHEEDPALIENNGVNRGKASAYYEIGGSPREAEIVMVQRDLEIALETGAKIDIQHISSKEAVELVRQAKKRGSNIHAEATPHHFSLTEEAVIKHGTLAKMNPPLREEADRQAIIRGLADGTIDMIATDHAPHSAEEKAKPITQAPSGIIGLETALSLGITNLVKPGFLTMAQLFDRMSTAPAALYRLDAGYVAEGGPADLILVDENATVVVEKFQSKSTNSPFVGCTLQGKLCATICDGKIVYNGI